MAKGWTKEERRKFLRERAHEPREKILTLAVLFLVVILFLAGIYYSLAYRLNPAIPILLVIALFVVVVFATFFVDYIFHESI